MPILIKGSGGGKPKLQEKTCKVEPYYTALSSWNEYDEIEPDSNYDGLSKVSVLRVMPRGIADVSAIASSSAEITFSFSSAKMGNITPDKLLGAYIIAGDETKCVNDYELVQGIFFSRKFRNASAYGVNLYGCSLYLANGTWTPNPDYSFAATIDSSKMTMTLNTYGNLKLSTDTYYKISPIYNRVSEH